MALALSRPPNWVLLGFAPIMAFAAVLGLFFARGRFAWAPGMTLASISGPIAMGAVLTYSFCLGRIDVAGREIGYSLKPWLGGNLLAAGVVGAVGVYLITWRRSEARGLLLRGLGAMIPMGVGLAGAAYAWKQQSRAGEDAEATPALHTLPAWASLGLLLACSLLAGIAACACGHFLIRAFEVGAGEAKAPPAASGLPVTRPMDARSS